MKWHDCKTDPPKESGYYIVRTTNDYEEDWIGAIYYSNGKNVNYYVNEYPEIGYWFDDYKACICYDDCVYKWAEVDLDDED